MHTNSIVYCAFFFFLDVRSTDFEVCEITKDQRVQRVVEEQKREKRLITEEKRVVIDEHRKRADVVPQMMVQEVDDDWFEVLDTTPSEKRSVPSGGNTNCMSYSLFYPGIASGERHIVIRICLISCFSGH